MKKLNNKGMTTIEVIVCFALVVIITLTMYTTISSFNQKRLIEGYKSRIYTYKNLLTKEIQDDFIKIGLVSATKKREVRNSLVIYTVNCKLKDGTNRELVIEQQLTYSKGVHEGGSTKVNDSFMIKYGTPTDLIEYPIPDLGEEEIKQTGNKVTKAKDLSLNNIEIDISDTNVLSIYIGFYHPELGTRYGIDIVAPINYINGGSDHTGFDL